MGRGHVEAGNEYPYLMLWSCFALHLLLNHASDALDIDSGTVQCTAVMQFAKPNKWFIGEIDKLIYSFHKTKGMYAICIQMQRVMFINIKQMEMEYSQQ